MPGPAGGSPAPTRWACTAAACRAASRAWGGGAWGATAPGTPRGAWAWASGASAPWPATAPRVRAGGRGRRASQTTRGTRGATAACPTAGGTSRSPRRWGPGARRGGGGKKGAGGKKGDAGKGKAPSSNLGGAFDKTGNFKSVFSLSDLTAELGSQLATDGDVSLSLLAGITEDSIPADIRNGFKFGLPSGLTGGTMDNVFSLSDMGKLEAPLLDLDNEQDSQQHI